MGPYRAGGPLVVVDAPGSGASLRPVVVFRLLRILRHCAGRVPGITASRMAGGPALLAVDMIKLLILDLNRAATLTRIKMREKSYI